MPKMQELPLEQEMIKEALDRYRKRREKLKTMKQKADEAYLTEKEKQMIDQAVEKAKIEKEQYIEDLRKRKDKGGWKAVTEALEKMAGPDNKKEKPISEKIDELLK